MAKRGARKGSKGARINKVVYIGVRPKGLKKSRRTRRKGKGIFGKVAGLAKKAVKSSAGKAIVGEAKKAATKQVNKLLTKHLK